MSSFDPRFSGVSKESVLQAIRGIQLISKEEMGQLCQHIAGASTELGTVSPESTALEDAVFLVAADTLMAGNTSVPLVDQKRVIAVLNQLDTYYTDTITDIHEDFFNATVADLVAGIATIQADCSLTHEQMWASIYTYWSLERELDRPIDATSETDRNSYLKRSAEPEVWWSTINKTLDRVVDFMITSGSDTGRSMALSSYDDPVEQVTFSDGFRLGLLALVEHAAAAYREHQSRRYTEIWGLSPPDSCQ